MKLIVNADDLGYNPGVNRGIITAFEEGVVTSTTMLVNGDYFEDTVELVNRCRNELGAGLHVNLTRGNPVSSPAKVSSLLDNNRFFWEIDVLYQKELVREEIKEEIISQLDKLKDSGIYPTHMDAHHHLQHHPLVLEVMSEIALIYKLPLRNVGEKTKKFFRENNIPTPDYFISSFFGKGATEDNLMTWLKELKIKGDLIVEVMTHPGYREGFNTRSSYREGRERELEILCSSKIKDFIKEEKITLVDYRYFQK